MNEQNPLSPDTLLMMIGAKEATIHLLHVEIERLRNENILLKQELAKASSPAVVEAE